MRRWLSWGAVVVAALAIVGCSSDQPSAFDATGGTSASGGQGGTGGALPVAGSGGTAGGAQCAVDQTSCTDGCRSLSSDVNNCGSCGHVCPVGQVCSSGVCGCTAPSTLCGGACVNLQGDGSNCGGCGIVCGLGQVCSAGVCGTTCSVLGETACSTSCVNLNTNASNCGACAQACGALQVCEAALCRCPANLLDCAGRCLDGTIDPLNCGACGVACAVGQSCQLGLCVVAGVGGAAGGAGAAGAGAGGNGGAGAGGTANNGGTAGASGVAGTGGTNGGAGTGGTGGTGGAGTGGTGGGAGSGGTGGGAGSGGTGGSGGAGSGGGAGTSSWYPCDGTTTGYNAVMTKSGSTWTVVNGGSERYSGTDMQAALTAAYSSLSSGRTTKQSILVQGSGDISASSQVSIPSYTILNICGTLNVTGTPSGSDRSPLYARGKRDIDIPNAKMTGSPQYGIFIRETDNVRLGQIDLRLTSSAGIGIRVDSGGSASTETTFNTNFRADYVYGSGMGSHILETYGIDGVDIGTIEGNDVGECGLLLNRSINAQVDLVTCTDCATGTGYAAFRVANDVGKVGSSYPANNIHVGKVYARGGGRGIFSVSGCGGVTIDQIDIANTGNTSILLQNTYNTTIAATSGTVVGGLVQISNDTTNTNNGRYPPSENVHIQNLTLSGGASVRQDWCADFGANGCTATNVTGGTVSMCN